MSPDVNFTVLLFKSYSFISSLYISMIMKSVLQKVLI
jgi:hypothetical protein